MGKRYYCDYCDRSFKDDTDSRKKHISSLQHINNRTAHYNQLKDPRDILREESGKIPCNRFMNFGDCPFRNNCRFSHLTPQAAWHLERMVAYKESLRIQEMSSESVNRNEIIDEFFQCPMINEEECGDNAIQYPIWNLPPELMHYPELPPSLSLITPESVVDSNFAKWGA